MTSNPERTMLMYAQLASIAAQKQQLIGRDRFLVLTGVAAAHAGWPQVADRCRELIAAHAPRHIITRYATLADALRDDEFVPFVRQTERFCSSERAEHLLSEMAVSVAHPSDGQSSGELALAMLVGL